MVTKFSLSIFFFIVKRYFRSFEERLGHRCSQNLRNRSVTSCQSGFETVIAINRGFRAMIAARITPWSSRGTLEQGEYRFTRWNDGVNQDRCLLPRIIARSIYVSIGALPLRHSQLTCALLYERLDNVHTRDRCARRTRDRVSVCARARVIG